MFDIWGAPDSLNIGFGRPSPGSDDMIDSLLVFSDVGLGSRKIWPGYSLFRRLLAKDVLELDLGVVIIMRNNELGDPVINRCISRPFMWNDGGRALK